VSQRAYKRSWKNLLINKRYQLRFTLFMAGLAAVMMTLLGWWVTKVAGEATNVAKSRQRGRICTEVPEEKAPAPAAVAPTPPVPEEPPPAAGSAVAVDVGEMKEEPDTGEGSGSGPGSGSGVGSGSGEDDGHHRVVIDESSMRIDPATAPVAPPPTPVITAEERAKLIAERDACERDIARESAKIDATNRNIVFVLVGSGFLLTLGLAVFGIKMTHKVAGPLHKVTLYLGKMRDGRYDKVYDLRKGDQLVAFYEHFKHAHAGAVRLEQEDVARIKAALAAAEASGAATRDPAVERAAGALAEALARKEKSLGG
jgi:hypothetical protein